MYVDLDREACADLYDDAMHYRGMYAWSDYDPCMLRVTRSAESTVKAIRRQVEELYRVAEESPGDIGISWEVLADEIRTRR